MPKFKSSVLSKPIINSIDLLFLESFTNTLLQYYKPLHILVKIEEGGLDLFYFSFHFLFYFYLFLYFIFLEQLGLGWIGHAVTSVT